MKNIRHRQQFLPSFCLIYKLHLFLLIFVPLFLFPSLNYANELKGKMRVLVLFTKQSDLPGYSLVEKGIESSLSNGAEFHIECFMKFMDNYCKGDETHDQLLRVLYHHKISKHKMVYGHNTDNLFFYEIIAK